MGLMKAKRGCGVDPFTCSIAMGLLECQETCCCDQEGLSTMRVASVPAAPPA